MRWIWIDRLLELQHRHSARALKTLSMAEDQFGEHFPGYPVMPASLMLEGLAQTGGILVGEANNFQEKVVLAKITKAKFHREVLAGEVLHYETEILNLRAEGASVQGRVKVDDELIGEADIFFAHLDQNRSQQMFGDENFIFDGELKKLMKMAKYTASETTEKTSS